MNDVLGKLIELHREYQLDGGFDDADSITNSTRSLVDLKGFDSLLIPPLLRELASKVGQPFQKGERVKNIYVDGQRKLTLEEIAELFSEHCLIEEAKVA